VGEGLWGNVYNKGVLKDTQIVQDYQNHHIKPMPSYLLCLLPLTLVKSSGIPKYEAKRAVE